MLGRHENAVKCIEYCREKNVIVCGNWDGCVKIWDDSSQNPCVGTLNQTDKVYIMDVMGELDRCWHCLSGSLILHFKKCILTEALVS